ncbi:MAG: hypothetical protein HETSPECPRED_000771 [Heterodermia speciosa]|uniref:Effector protein n=1 Tax=Heterodermia speciosa TaxID=116794 RepID=A0A8H3IY94_9LECA|nr:MAG: hypothetical protein HETSPECPRED_000771 [Heterodermia speciosa]
MKLLTIFIIPFLSTTVLALPLFSVPAPGIAEVERVEYYRWNTTGGAGPDTFDPILPRKRHWVNHTSPSTNSSSPILPRGVKEDGEHNVTTISAGSPNFTVPISQRAVEHHGRYNVTSSPILPREMKKDGEHNVTTFPHFTVPIPERAVEHHGRYNVTPSTGVTKRHTNITLPDIITERHTNITLPDIITGRESIEETVAHIMIHVPGPDSSEEGKWNVTKACWFDIPVKEMGVERERCDDVAK